MRGGAPGRSPRRADAGAVSRPPLSAMLTLIVALSILAVIAITTAIPPNDQLNPSSRSAGSLGTLAIYTWFSNLGLDVGRITGSFDLTGSDVVFCYDPTVALTRTDVGAVMAFLRSGGDLVLVVTPGSLAAAAPLLGKLRSTRPRRMGAGVATVAQPFDSTDRVHVGPGERRVDVLRPATARPDLVEQDEVVAGMVRVGSWRRVRPRRHRAALQRRPAPWRFVVPRAEPVATRSRRPDQF